MIADLTHSLPNGTCRWPAAIPRAARQPWRLSSGFDAPWMPAPETVHRVVLLNHYLVIEVLAGALVARYGLTRHLVESPDAVACSAREMQVEALEPTFCRINVFRQPPLHDHIVHGDPGFMRRHLEAATGTLPGIFQIGPGLAVSPNAGMFGNITFGDPGRMLVASHLLHPNVEQFCGFLASGPWARELDAGLPRPDHRWVDPLDDTKHMIQAGLERKRRDLEHDFNLVPTTPGHTPPTIVYSPIK